MQEDFTLKYQSGGAEKDINFSLDPTTQKIINGLQNPFKLIRNSGALGIKGAGAFFGIIATAIIINVAFLIIALVSTAISVFQTGLISLVLVLLAGALFCFVMIRKAYGFAFTKVLELLYRGIRPLFKKLCSAIIDKIADEVNKRKSPNTFFENSAGMYAIYNDKLAALPPFARKALWFVIKRIPFVKFIDKEITDVILKGDNTRAAEVLFTRTDNYITENIFEANNLKWLWWMLPLNIAVQLALIIVKL